MHPDDIAKAGSLAHEMMELKNLVKQLQARQERQSLVIQVLKDMVLGDSKASEEQFLERLQAKASQKVDGHTCHKCGKPMSAKHTKCIYCGAMRHGELF
jgi:hypothetical protein